MSRTIRRKNAFNKKDYVDDWLEDDWSLHFLRGTGNVRGGRRNGKYANHTDQQIYDKLNARFHGETPKGWNVGDRNRKRFSKWHLRQVNKMELKNAMKTGDEENLHLTEKKYDGVGVWWYWD